MPNIYLDRPLMDVVRDEAERMERKADGDVYVSEKEALYRLLDEDAQRRVDKERDRAETY